MKTSEIIARMEAAAITLTNAEVLEKLQIVRTNSTIDLQTALNANNILTAEAKKRNLI